MDFDLVIGSEDGSVEFYFDDAEFKDAIELVTNLGIEIEKIRSALQEAMEILA